MTRQRQIIISREVYERLRNLFFSEFEPAFSDEPYLQSLRGELDIAKIVAPEEFFTRKSRQVDSLLCPRTNRHSHTRRACGCGRCQWMKPWG